MRVDEAKEVWDSARHTSGTSGAGAGERPSNSSTGCRCRRVGHGSTSVAAPGRSARPFSNACSRHACSGSNRRMGSWRMPAAGAGPPRGLRTGRCPGAALWRRAVRRGGLGAGSELRAEPGRMVANMRRGVRPGGTVALYVWDYAGEMQLMRRFWDAAAALDPAARELDRASVSRSARRRRSRTCSARRGSPPWRRARSMCPRSFGDSTTSGRRSSAARVRRPVTAGRSPRSGARGCAIICVRSLPRSPMAGSRWSPGLGPSGASCRRRRDPVGPPCPAPARVKSRRRRRPPACAPRSPRRAAR